MSDSSDSSDAPFDPEALASVPEPSYTESTLDLSSDETRSNKNYEPDRRAED